MEEIVNVDFQKCFIFIFLCVLSVLSVLCYSLFFKKPKYGFDLPPSPPSLPIIGHLHHLLSLHIHKSLQNLSSKYGPLLYLRVFSVPIVLVSSPLIAYEIFKTQDVNVSARSLPTNEGSLFFGSLCFATAPYGEYWKFMKKLIMTKPLGPQALEMSQSVRSNELERFYLNLLKKAMKKKTVEVVEEAMKLINNIIYKIIIGRSCSEESGEAERLRGLVNESDTKANKFFLGAILRKPLKMLGISLFKKELMDLSRKFNEVLEKILVEYEEKQDEYHQGTDMMDTLLEAYRDENAEYKITRNHVKSLFLDIFVAGVGTSTHIIQRTMPELINNPCILQEDKIREDVLKYLPFGSGRRGCPGANLAYASLGTSIGVMVQCFDWTIKGDKVNMNETPGGVTLSMAHPLKCTLVARTIIPLT